MKDSTRKELKMFWSGFICVAILVGIWLQAGWVTAIFYVLTVACFGFLIEELRKTKVRVESLETRVGELSNKITCLDSPEEKLREGDIIRGFFRPSFDWCNHKVSNDLGCSPKVVRHCDLYPDRCPCLEEKDESPN